MGIDETTWPAGVLGLRAVLAAADDAGGAAVGVLDCADAGVHLDRAAHLHAQVAAAFPHHAGAELGVLEFLDERGDVLLIALGQQGIHHRVGERQVLDALRGEIGRELVDRHTPKFLVVRLEEVIIETPAEAGDDPALEGGLVLGRADARPDVGHHAAEGLDDAEVGQRVGGLERVIVVLAVIVNAAHARAQHEVFVGQDLVPERLDFLHFREEAVATDIETPAVALDRPADAADDVIGLKDGGSDAVTGGENVGGSEASGTRADDDDWLLGHEARIYTFLHQRLQAGAGTKCVFSSNRTLERRFAIPKWGRQAAGGLLAEGGE